MRRATWHRFDNMARPSDLPIIYNTPPPPSTPQKKKEQSPTSITARAIHKTTTSHTKRSNPQRKRAPCFRHSESFSYYHKSPPPTTPFPATPEWIRHRCDAAAMMLCRRDYTRERVERTERDALTQEWERDEGDCRRFVWWLLCCTPSGN